MIGNSNLSRSNLGKPNKKIRKITPINNPEVPSPQDPFNTMINKGYTSPPKNSRAHSPLSSPKKNSSLPFIDKYNTNKTNNNSPTNDKISQKNELLVKFDEECDSFFLSLTKNTLHLAVENFIKSIFNFSNVIFWQVIPSIQHLYSYRLEKIISLQNNLVGIAFSQRDILKIPIANQHPNFDKNIDGEILNPRSSLILFPLMDSKNSIFSVVECILQNGENHFPDNLDLFLTIFTRKFRIFSHWILQPVSIDSVLMELVPVMETEQLLLYLQSQMIQIFNCRKFEIWKLSKKTGEIICYSDKPNLVLPQESGLIGDVLKREQPIQVLNVRFSSAYCGVSDGLLEEPVLAIPYFSLSDETIYTLVLRGNKKSPVFSNYDENSLKKLTPIIISSFKNSQIYSQTKRGENGPENFVGAVLSSLPLPGARRSSNDYLNQMMNNLKHHSNSDRISFYIVNWKERYLESIFHKGLNTSIKQPIGQGLCGRVAEIGNSINITDAYENSTFDSSIYMKTCYRKKSVLTVPITNTNGIVSAIIQLINRKDGQPFSQSDIDSSRVVGTLCLCLIENSNLTLTNEDLLNRFIQFSKIIFQSQLSISILSILPIIYEIISNVLSSSICVLLVYDEALGILRSIDPNNKLIENIKDGFISECFFTKKTISSNDCIQTFISSENQKIKRFCMVPLYHHNSNSIGVLYVANKETNYTELDISTLTTFSGILSLIIFEEKSLRIAEKGLLQLEMDKYISISEFGQIKIPDQLVLTDELILNINTLNINLINNENNILFSIVFHIFDSLNLNSNFNISNDQLFIFLSKLNQNYPKYSFNNFSKAIDSVQFMYFLINHARLNLILKPYEIFALITSCLFNYIGYDGKTDEIHKRIESPYSILYSKIGIINTKTTSIMIEMIKDLIKNLNEEDLIIFWKISIELIKSSSLKSSLNILDKVKEVIKTSTLDLNNFYHRNLLMILLFNGSNIGFTARPFKISEKWHELQSLEWFKLGDIEMFYNLTLSSRFNSPDLYEKKTSMLEILDNYSIPIFEVLSSMYPELKIISNEIKKNYEIWKNLN